MAEPSIATRTATIAASGTVSDAVDLGNCWMLGLLPASTWDTQNITFQVSVDEVNFYDLYYEGTQVSFAACAAEKYQAVEPAKFLGIRYVKVVSGAAQVDQTTVAIVVYNKAL